MLKILQGVNKNLTLAIPLTMVAGFFYGIYFESGVLKELIMPFTFLMVYPMMVTLKIKQVLKGGDGKAQLLTQGVNFLLIPFVAFALGTIFFPGRPYLVLGLVLAALVPTSGMTISWTGFAKGNVEAAVKMTVVGLIAGSLATPLYVKALLGAQVSVDTMGVMKQISVIVFLPMILGYVTQQWAVKRYGVQEFQQGLAPKFPLFSTIGVLGIVFIAIALKAKAVAAAPHLLLVIIPPLLLLYLINYSVSTFIGKTLLPTGDAIALVYGTVMRNLSIALAVAINAFGPAGSEAALVISLAYIIQVQSAAWYVKFCDRIFGCPAVAGR